MSFRDCIQAAVEAGTVRPKKAEKAIQLYEDAHAAALDEGLEGGAAFDKAGLEAMDALSRTTTEKKWQMLRRMQAVQRITEDIARIDEFSTSATRRLLGTKDQLTEYANGIETAARRIEFQAHAQADAILTALNPTLFRQLKSAFVGRDSDRLAEVAFGDREGTPLEQEMLKGVKASYDFLVDRANLEGAMIKKLKNYVPQNHDRLKMTRAGRETWVEEHMRPGILDWDRMRSHFDNKPIPEEKRQQVLERVFDIITTRGYAKLKPGSRGGETVADSLNHARFMHYASGKSWRQMNDKYGAGDFFDQWASGVSMMARDIAIMEKFGPDPDAMRSVIYNTMKRRAADLQHERGPGPSKGRTVISEADEAIADFDTWYSLFRKQVYNGEEEVMANAMASTRTYVNSTLLGSAFIPNLTDFVFAKQAARLNGMAETGKIRNMVQLVASEKDRNLALRSGLGLESAVSMALGFQRYFGPMMGGPVARKYADISMRASFLTPLTQATKHTNGLEQMHQFHLAKRTKFENLPFRDFWQMRGITAEDWDLFRSIPSHTERGWTLLRPDDLVLNGEGDPIRNRRVADKIMDAIHEHSRLAVPHSTTREQAFLIGRTEPGSFPGELARSWASIKSFPATIMLNNLRHIMMMSPDSKSALVNTARFVLALTMAGALIQQMRALAFGRDPVDTTTAEFWSKSALYGGGLGVLGDLIMADLTMAASGPIVDFLNRSKRLGIDNIVDAYHGKETSFMSDAVQFGGRYGPFTQLWQTKLLLRRLILDEAMRMADPKAHRRLKMNERRRAKEQNQESFWRPGETAPRRGPNFGAMVGGAR